MHLFVDNWNHWRGSTYFRSEFFFRVLAFISYHTTCWREIFHVHSWKRFQLDPIEKNRIESDDAMYIQHSSPFRASRFGRVSHSYDSRFRRAGKQVRVRDSWQICTFGKLEERTVKYNLHPVFYILLDYSVYRLFRAHSGQVAMNIVSNCGRLKQLAQFVRYISSPPLSFFFQNSRLSCELVRARDIISKGSREKMTWTT